MTELQIKLRQWYDFFIQVYPTKVNIELGFEFLYRNSPKEGYKDQLLHEIREWVIKYQEIKHHAHEDQFIRELPNVYTFFKSQRWKDPLPEIKRKKEVIFHQACDCGLPSFIHHSSPDKQPYCCECYVKTFAKQRKYLTGYGRWHYGQKV